jgi:hypothetical protein
LRPRRTVLETRHEVSIRGSLREQLLDHRDGDTRHEVSIRGSLREQLLDHRDGETRHEVSIRGSLREQLPFETASFLGLLRASLDHRRTNPGGRVATRGTSAAYRDLATRL